MKQVVDLEMEWGIVGRCKGPRPKSIVRVEYVPYAPTLQYKLKYPRAAVLKVEGWNILAIPPRISSIAGNKNGNYTRFRKLFREVTGYRGKGLLQAVQADYEAQLNGRYRR